MLDEELLGSRKEQISESFLNRAGIHGVGVSRKAGTIRVYFEPSKDPSQEKVFPETRMHMF